MRKFLGLCIGVTAILLQACSQPSTPDFQQMALSRLPNYYLSCPANYCNVTPNAVSPEYPVSAEDLFNLFNQIISKTSRIKFTYSMPEQGQFQLLQESLVLRLPDDITVQFIALSDTTSTLAIYSKSRYSLYDFGANKRRVESWLTQLLELSRHEIKNPYQAEEGGEP